MTEFSVLSGQVSRRNLLLNEGIGLGEIDEYNTLTTNLAESVGSLLRALNDVIKLRDELLTTPEGPAAPVARAFGQEIDRALKGKR
jgi:hypothetical protein